MAEWGAAAEYKIKLSIPSRWQKQELVAGPSQTVELTLAVNYSGDAARIYFGDRLLTDNWYSGYRGDGSMEVGLSYLAGENPGVLADDAELTLLILPLKKATIDVSLGPPDGEAQVFLQRDYWPDFNGDDAVLKLHELRWIATAHVPVSVC